MMVTSTPQEIHAQLLKNSLFQTWKKNHTNSFLSHFFCQLSNTLVEKTSWEIGYYNPDHNKITIFVELKNNEFEIKPEDDIFKQEATAVEHLETEKIIISFDQAKETFLQQLPIHFSKQVLGDGFIVLQCLNKKILWNFTYITTQIQFVNLKIDAENGQVYSVQTVDLVDKKSDKLNLSK